MCFFTQAQTVLTYQGQTYNYSQGQWLTVPHNVRTTFSFLNNSITSSATSMYILSAGDEGIMSTNNNLDGEIISGNKFVWNDPNPGQNWNSITHGVFTGCMINVQIKYNYLQRIPMGIIRKSGSSMTNTSGGVSYNIINSFNVGGVVKGMNHVYWYNNTFYQDRTTAQTWRACIDIYENDDSDANPNPSPARYTKIKNNIFYTKYKTRAISITADSRNGFECDYNVYWCEEGDHTPVFQVAGSLLTWNQWRALGYDQHSVVMNPDFIDFVNFVPRNRLDYGTNLGTEWQTGLSTSATWVVGTAPTTTNQNGTWQVGARIHAAQTPPTPPSGGNTYFLAPNGNDATGNGTINNPWFSLTRAWQSVSAGDIIYMRGGTYQYTKQILQGKSGTDGNTIKVFAYNNEKPNITKSPSYGSGTWPIALILIQNGNYLHFKGLEISGFTQQNEYIWSGFWVFNSQNSIFEAIDYHHNGSPMALENTNNCTVLNCDFHHNQDPLTSHDPYGNSDGFGMNSSPDRVNDVNYIIGCRSWWNTDDGYDVYGYYGILYIENCWAWHNGYIPDTFTTAGEGMGFKLGGNNGTSSNSIKRFVSNCVSFRNRNWGYTENTDAYNMKIVNNVSYQNKYIGGTWGGGFHFNTPGVAYEIRNNISYNDGGTDADLNVTTNVSHNTWNSGFTVSGSDFISLNLNEIMAPRKPDGSLPDVNLFHLAQGSNLIDKGINVGLPYNGNAPDLGAFETNYSLSASLPTVTTTSITNIGTTTATGGGNVTSDGGTTVTARGVCWSTSQNPTISNSRTTNGTGTGSFTSSLTSLSSNTTYYVRAYATNSVGTAYGNQISFRTTTGTNTLPTVTTTIVSSITGTNAVSGGNVTSDGGSPVTARGVCWDQSGAPALDNPHTTDGTGTGSFKSNITGLISGRTYYVKAYATNAVGTSYGNMVSFTTGNPPTVTTTSVTNITSSTATSGGNVTSSGGSTVTARGVCWATTQNPTINNSITTNGSGTGTFTSSLTGLLSNTTYYVRAYATNSAGTTYGNVIQFTTANKPNTYIIKSNQYKIKHGKYVIVNTK